MSASPPMKVVIDKVTDLRDMQEAALASRRVDLENWKHRVAEAEKAVAHLTATIEIYTELLDWLNAASADLSTEKGQGA